MKALKDYLPTLLKLSLLRYFVPYLRMLGPARFRRFVVERVPVQTVQRIKEISDTLTAVAVEIYTSKKRALELGDKAATEQILGDGHDILSVLSGLFDVDLRPRAHASFSARQHGGC